MLLEGSGLRVDGSIATVCNQGIPGIDGDDSW